MEIIYKASIKEYSLKVAEKDAVQLNKPELVFEMVKNDFNPVQEEMYLLILDTQNKIIEKHLLSKGAIDATVITPAEIFRPVFLTNGNKFILAHNHPSGNCTPSKEDVVFTNRIKNAAEVCGLHLLDHVIYSADEFISLRKEGEL